MKYLILYFSFVFLHLIDCHAASTDTVYEGEKFPAVISVDGHYLIRQGLGVRTASVFHVKVYAAGFYSQGDNPSQFKDIELFPLYDISKADSEKGWKVALNESCASQCKEIEKDLEAFLKSVPEFKKRDHHRFLWTHDQVEVRISIQ